MKKIIIRIFLISLVLLTTVGFSAWYIIYQIDLKPEKVVSSISQYFGLSQEVVYNEQEQVPVQKNGMDIEVIDPSTITYSYKLESDTNYTVGKPINANIYDVKIKVNDGRECVVKFTIKPKEVWLDQTTIELNYIANQYRQWESMSTELRKHIKFVDSEKVLLPNINYNVDSIDNGDIVFSKKSNSTRNIYGSTYYVNLSLNDSNYKLVGDTHVLLKYKTCKIGDQYYTIEDALATSGDITLVGDASNTNSYVVTSFSKILSTNTYDLSSRRLLLPFDNNNTNNYMTSYDGAEANWSNVFSGLYIPTDITLNLKNNASLVAGGVVTYAGAVKRRSVIMNDGTINVENSAKLLSYGFTKGNGLIVVKAGGEVQDVFKINDWPGADEALKLKDNYAFPVLNWGVHNITCETKVFKDGRYNAMSYIVVARGLGKLEINDIFVIGDSNTTNCLFRPNGGSNDDYIIKKATIINDTFNKDSQSTTIPNQIIISGKYIDRSLKLSIKWGLINYSFETSTSIAVPISYYDIILKNNSHLTFSSSSYILYDKSKIHIESGSTLEILGSAYLYVLNNSRLIVDGNLSGNGSISNIDETKLKTNGAPIETNSSGALMTISNYNVSKCVIKKDATSWITINGSTTGYVNTPGNIGPLTNGNVYKSEGIDQYYFEAGKSVKKYHIDFVVEGQTHSETYYSIGEDLIIKANSLKNVQLRHYEFVGWYLDQNYQQPFINHTFTTDDERLTLYAKFKEKTYTFAYLASYGYLDGAPNYIEPVLSNKTPGFTLSDIKNGKIKITTKASYLDKYFDGWYIGNNKTNYPHPISEFTLEMLEEYLNILGENQSQIYLYCEFSDLKVYEIKFVTNNNIVIDSFSTKEDTIDLTSQNQQMDKYDDDINYQFYFEKWYLDSNYTEEFISNKTSISAVIKDGNILTLYAKPLDKIEVTINHRSIGANPTKKYVISGKTVDLSNFKYDDQYLHVANVYDGSGSLVDNIQTINVASTYELEYAVVINVNINNKGTVTKVSDNSNVNNGDLVILGTELKLFAKNYWGVSTVKVSWCDVPETIVESGISNSSRQVTISYKVSQN